MITRIYFWKVANRNIAWAVSRMALDRLALSGNPSIEFWKLLGAGKGETFTPRDADPNRWGLLIRIEERQLSNFENSALMNRWRDKSTSSFSATLRTISSHGKWSRREPFHSEIEQREWNGAVAAITRARIKTLKNFTFWRSVPPVSGSRRST